ncbi:MAG: PaaI family thioesterase [Sphingobacteriaceae bacterium]|nr:PaaI family thioesterase [Sphingobacteriaceae bacterium]
MNSLIEKYIQHNNFGKQLGMHFNIIADGEVEYFLKITPDHLATPLSAHGGVISSLADAALGVAGLSAVYKENKVVSTVEYKINFLAPAVVNDELVAHAKVLQKGKRILIVECTIFCENYLPLGGSTPKGGGRKLIAKAIGTFNAYDATKAGY